MAADHPDCQARKVADDRGELCKINDPGIVHAIRP